MSIDRFWFPLEGLFISINVLYYSMQPVYLSLKSPFLTQQTSYYKKTPIIVVRRPA